MVAILLLLMTGTVLGQSSEEGDREGKLAARKELVSLGVPFSADSLISAIREGDTLVFDLLLAAGVDVDASRGGTRPLLKAVTEGREAMVVALLAAGADPDAKDQTGDTAVILASRSGNVDVLDLLVRANADLFAQNNRGETALHRPADINVVQKLVSMGRTVDVADEDGETPLWRAAVVYGHTRFVEVLLEAGADPNATKGRMPAWLEAHRRGNHDVVDVLVAAGANVDQTFKWPPDGEGVEHSELSKAAWEGDLQTVERMIELGADINRPAAVSRWAPNPLGYAVWEGHASVVEVLIASGADVNNAGTWKLGHEDDAEVVSPLCIEILDYGLIRRNNRNAYNYSTSFPETTRAWLLHEQIVDILVELGADPPKRCPILHEPLLWELWDRFCWVYSALSEGTWSLTLDPEFTACATVRRNILRRLVSAGVDINERNTSNGDTLLKRAAELAHDYRKLRSGGRRSLYFDLYAAQVALFHSLGADPIIADNEGKTVYDSIGHSSFRRILKYGQTQTR